MKQLLRPSLKLWQMYFLFILLIISLVCFFPSCSDSSDNSPDIHADFFEVSDSPVTVGSSSYYITRLKTSLTDCPQNLVVPQRINGKKIEGFYSNAFSTYSIQSVYVHSEIKNIPYMLLSDSGVKKITVSKKFKDSFLIPSGTEVVYY